MLIAPLQANAMSVSIGATDIQSFTQIAATGSPITLKTAESAEGASFTTVWGFAISGLQSADIGVTGLGYDWTGFDTFVVGIANNNESTWSFTASVSDGSSTATSPVQTLPNNGIQSVFTVDISGLNVASIVSVFVTVMGDLPINGFDRTAEYSISSIVPLPVPVPAATWLFASALGLLLWAQKRAAPGAAAR
ncbi:MAG: hypothetical protein ACE5G3_03310 [Gammaproteobacteria bacterium]